MTKIVIAGVAGRMGQVLVRCVRDVPEVAIVGATEAPGHAALGQDAGMLSGAPALGVPVTADLRAALEEADALVDFTFHTAVPGNVRVAHELRRAAVVGTTALSESELEVLTTASRDIPIVWAPNMSLGVNLLFALVRRAAEALGSGYRIEIDETHHVHKKDAPSGTALRLGEKAAEGRKLDFERALVTAMGDAPADAGTGRILIRSHREGEVVGDHTVVFENAGERIELTHKAHSRDAFALGALKAAAWAVRQRPRLYDMQDVLGLR